MRQERTGLGGGLAVRTSRSLGDKSFPAFGTLGTLPDDALGAIEGGLRGRVSRERGDRTDDILLVDGQSAQMRKTNSWAGVMNGADQK